MQDRFFQALLIDLGLALQVLDQAVGIVLGFLQILFSDTWHHFGQRRLNRAGPLVFQRSLVHGPGKLDFVGELPQAGAGQGVERLDPSLVDYRDRSRLVQVVAADRLRRPRLAEQVSAKHDDHHHGWPAGDDAGAAGGRLGGRRRRRFAAAFFPCRRSFDLSRCGLCGLLLVGQGCQQGGRLFAERVAVGFVTAAPAQITK